MKVKKYASGRTIIKISHQEWVQIGKEAGFWDNVKQVGKGIGEFGKGVGKGVEEIGRGIGQGIKGVGEFGKGVAQSLRGAWDAGSGLAGIVGDISKGVSNLVQKIKSRMQQGQVSSQESGQYQQMIEGMQNDLAAAEAELAAIDQQTAQRTAQRNQQGQKLGQYQQMIEGMQNDLASAEAELQAINQQTQIAASVKPIKLKKYASGRTTIKISENKWQQIGVKNGWIKQSQEMATTDFTQVDAKSLYQDIISLLESKGIGITGEIIIYVDKTAQAATKKKKKWTATPVPWWRF